MVTDAVAQVGASGTIDTAAMVSVPEAAHRLGLGQTKVKKLIASGELRSVLVEGRRLVPVSAITAYVEELDDIGGRAI